MSGPVIGEPTVVLDSPDPTALADFYCRLLGWENKSTDPDPTWVMIGPPGERSRISFQLEPEYERPTWPSTHEKQQMMMHLDIHVRDLQEAKAHADALGARAADWQPQPHVLVYADPDGHIFCLFTE